MSLQPDTGGGVGGSRNPAALPARRRITAAYALVRKETMYTPDNQKLLFPALVASGGRRGYEL